MRNSMQKLILGLLGFVMMWGLSLSSASACTGIRMIAEDKGVVYGRTMEFGEFDLQSRVSIIPRGYSFRGQTPDGINGKKWKAKYGAVGVDMFNKPILTDGMNEKGLTVGFFNDPGFTNYQSYEKKTADISIAPSDVVNYILTQFKTLEEVREGMANVRVVPVVYEETGAAYFGHWMVTTPDGKSLVIEYIDGKVKFYDNKIGVMTNAPTFDWHMINLRNYINLSGTAYPAKEMNGMEFKPLGLQSGMLGLPGDFTPPSRFVRAVAWTQTARKCANARELIYEHFRILDNFNLPPEDTKSKSKIKLRGSTVWTTGYDLNDRVFYYHTVNNRRIRKVDLKRIDFSTNSDVVRTIPLDKTKSEDVEDITPVK